MFTSVAASPFRLSNELLLTLSLLLALEPVAAYQHHQRAELNPAVSSEPRYEWDLGRRGFMPVIRNKWLEEHEAFVEQGRTRPIDLLFVGDSITEAWSGPGKAVWQAHYEWRNAANFGISGDRTENLLWRLENGELRNIQPKIAVVLIGTNNISRTPADSPGEIAAGIWSVVRKLKSHDPDTKVLLMGLLPRADITDVSLNERVADVNRLIEKIADNRRVFFLDIGVAFLGEDGTPSRDLLPDLLHPNARGYEIWAEALDVKLASMLTSNARSLARHVGRNGW